MIPQNNPLANYLSYKSAIDEAIRRVLASGHYILAEETAAFEQEFAEYIGVKYAIGVGSGTEALHLALLACDIGPGDEVVTVSHTAVATIAAIEMCGAHPVLVDIDLNSYTINPGHVEEAITDHTKAIVPVHLYGQPSDLKPLIECAKRYNLFLIEDCAQSHGAVYHGRKVGSWGNAGTFSFYPTKNLSCLGDGGAVTTDSLELHDKLLLLRQYGWNHDRISHRAGYNSRLDELQAAMLRIKLRHLNENNSKRIQIAHTYDQLLDSPDITLPTIITQTIHVYHQYVICCAKMSIRDDLIKFMRKRKIQTAIHYPIPVHLQPAYMNRVGAPNSLPITKKVSETILSLPMFPELNKEDIDKIATTIHEFFTQTS